MNVRVGDLCGVRILWRDTSMFRHWGWHRYHHGRSLCLGRTRIYTWWR